MHHGQTGEPARRSLSKMEVYGFPVERGSGVTSHLTVKRTKQSYSPTGMHRSRAGAHSNREKQTHRVAPAEHTNDLRRPRTAHEAETGPRTKLDQDQPILTR